LTELIGFLWQQGLERPMINLLIILSNAFGGSFGLAILGLTVIIRALTMPLTMKQLHSSKALQQLQPKLQELQKKYKDPRRRSEETMRLYREAGVNPFGCLVPMLIQFPIWIALYRGLTVTVGGTPELLIDLSGLLYPWTYIQDAIPLASHFLWMDLGQPDLVLPFLVGISTFLQTKMTQTRNTTDPRTQSMNQMMLWMMPLMFGWFSLTVPSGLALYWLTTNLIGIVTNYFVFGWGGLRQPRAAHAPAAALKGGDTVTAATQPSPKGRRSNGRGRSKR
jgi:YidC/Oxa1 family membrane protein insertase